MPLQGADSAVLTLNRFRWAACQLDVLQDCVSPSQIKEELHHLPETLDETYQRMIDSLKPVHKSKAIFLLQLLSISTTPLKLDAAVDALATDLDRRVFDPNNRLCNATDIAIMCPSLIMIDSDTNVVQFSHFSVKEYLQSNRTAEVLPQYFSEINVKRAIVCVCLSYFLSLNLNLDRKEITRTRPFTEHCCEHWFWLANKADDNQGPIATMIYSLLTV